jgi:hypothetical protein
MGVEVIKVMIDTIIGCCFREQVESEVEMLQMEGDELWQVWLHLLKHLQRAFSKQASNLLIKDIIFIILCILMMNSILSYLLVMFYLLITS